MWDLFVGWTSNLIHRRIRLFSQFLCWFAPEGVQSQNQNMQGERQRGQAGHYIEWEGPVVPASSDKDESEAIL